MDIVLEELTAGLPDTTRMVRVAVRLVTAMVLGAMVGFERERAGKSAGLRTHMLVALGAALFVLIPSEAGQGLSDLTRVIQGIATGIGFIGTGAILKRDDQGDIQGLTTAAGLWLTAAVGVAAGLGRSGAAIFSILLALVILAVLTKAREWIGSGRAARTKARG